MRAAGHSRRRGPPVPPGSARRDRRPGPGERAGNRDQIAIALGVIIGLVLVGFHAIQVSKLGVPQMIQSRGQFGFYGAVLVFAASIVLDFGFLAAQLVIQADAMNLLVSSISIPGWIAI